MPTSNEMTTSTDDTVTDETSPNQMHTDDTQGDAIQHCANCGTVASRRCLGCIAAPEHQAGDAPETVYCNKNCQRAHWRTHRPRCLALQSRTMLFRTAWVMRDIAMAYRESTFPNNMFDVRLDDGTVYITYGEEGRPGMMAFPESLTADNDLRQAALMNNQCQAALCIAAHLVKHLFAAIKPIEIRKIDARVMPAVRWKITNYIEFDPLHTILEVQLGPDEYWMIDPTGCQYGFPEFIEPSDTYELMKIGDGQIRDGGDYDMEDGTSDLTGVLSNADERIVIRRLGIQLKVRRDFLRSTKTRFDDKSAREFLSGSNQDFANKLYNFIREFKAPLTTIVGKLD